MPNYCNFKIKVTGEEECVKEFIGVLKADYDYSDKTKVQPRHFFRVFDLFEESLESRDGNASFMATGECAWSVYTCMTEGGYYRKDFGENFNATTLAIESRRLGLSIEIYSEEEGCQFQEHYLYKDGEMLIDECVDWCHYYLSDYDSLEELNEINNSNFTMDDFDEDIVSVGGFDSWEFSI